MKSLASQTQPPGLYVVATPIGNLGDITLRAIECLKAADVIACEDTRVTAKLLSAYGIAARTISYHDHSDEKKEAEILSLLAEGKRVALVSDAGTPLISDPGFRLVRSAIEAGHYVTTLPGASSVMAALILSGIACERYFFAGFLPAKTQALQHELLLLKTIPSSLVFFESARRLTETLAAMQEVLGNRQAAVVREISKLFEEARRGTLHELGAYYEKQGEPKGEVVIVVAPPLAEMISDDDIKKQIAALLPTHGVKETSSLVAEMTGRSKKEIYALALKQHETK
ncbi:MAG: 16S rRNA (cytidine(1402)-2'-O)-methyltransferase [Rickettsiales bacterium]|jgi:16S rRNA (cytidine1402-2'-O)-methyltransferase|nr:16S rRNA (cytidine(1402)-2'-O)-methyltransferase [Rickettsiales bacterium]